MFGNTNEAADRARGTTGRKQHDFPKVTCTFTLDGIFKAYGGIILHFRSYHFFPGQFFNPLDL
jgi:hypothetical protein